MGHRLLLIVLGCLALLSLVGGQSAARVAGTLSAGRTAFPAGRDMPVLAVAPTQPARGDCAPNAGDWTIERPDAPKDFGAQGNRTLALDAAGLPHIVYGGDHLYYAWYDGTLWHREMVDPAIGVGDYASLALDADGHPHVSYYDDLKDDVKYAYFDGAAWHVEIVDPNMVDS